MLELPAVWTWYLESEAEDSTYSPSGRVTLAATAQAQEWTYPPGYGTRSLYSLRDASRQIRLED